MKRQNKFQYPGNHSQFCSHKLKDKLLVLIIVFILSLLLYPFGMLMIRLNTLDFVKNTEINLIKIQELEDFRYWLSQGQIHYTNYLMLRDKQDWEEWKSLWDKKIIPFLNNSKKHIKKDVFAYRFKRADQLAREIYTLQLNHLQQTYQFSDTLYNSGSIGNLEAEQVRVSNDVISKRPDSDQQGEEISKIGSSLDSLISQELVRQRNLARNNIIAYENKIGTAFKLFIIIGSSLIVLLLFLSYQLIDTFKKSMQSVTRMLLSLAKGETPSKQKVIENEIGRLVHFSNEIADHLREASAFAKAIGRGELDASFQAKSKNDILSHALIQMQNMLHQVKQKDEQQNYSRQGITELSVILQNSQQEEKIFFQEIINFIVNYLEAKQGAIFILDENNEGAELSMVSCYAYGRKKYLQKSMAIGEGLIGQSILEKDIIYLTNVPQNYTQITSGLGEATPNCLVIVPIIASDLVHGAFELALFNTLDEYQLEMLKQMGASLGHTIAGLKTSSRTNKLLAEAQQQAEELRAQEEEMRQNMEELQATQEEMNRIVAEQQGQISAINLTLATASFTVEGEITEANQNFLSLMDYDEGDLLGQNHSILVPLAERDSDEYQHFWHSLSKGGQHTDEYIRINKQGKKIWLKGTYTSVRNSEGIIEKVIHFAVDITEQKKLEMAVKEQLEAAQDMRKVLEESQEKMNVLFNSAMDGIIMIDERGTIELFNPAAENMFQYHSKEVIGQNIKLLMPNQYSQHHDTYLTRYKQTKKPHVIGMARSVSGERKDGSTFPLEIRVEKGMIRDRRVFVGILRDLSRSEVELFDDTAESNSTT